VKPVVSTSVFDLQVYGIDVLEGPVMQQALAHRVTRVDGGQKGTFHIIDGKRKCCRPYDGCYS
jgi:hypothetical protein